MKKHIKNLFIIALSILAFSCSKDDEILEPPKENFIENIDIEKFKNLKIGFTNEFIIPIEGYKRIEFTHINDTRVSKVCLDIEPEKKMTPKKDEYVLKLEKFILNENKYKGVRNPNVSEFLSFTKNKAGNFSEGINSWNSSPAPGIYNFKITVVDEKGKKSAISKKVKFIQAYKDIKIAGQKTHSIKYNNISVKQGSKSIPIAFHFNPESIDTKEIKFKLIPPDWSWTNKNDINKSIKLETYKKEKNKYAIKYDFLIDPKIPKGIYEFYILSDPNESIALYNQITIE
jgi:hypothetical protein